MLLNAEDLERILKRPVPERVGRPVVGVDMGENQGMVRGDGMVSQWAFGSGRHRSRST